MKKLRGYIFSRSFMGERVPQHVQNIVIRDYCSRHGFEYLLSAAEYAMDDCHLVFEQIMEKLTDIDGIVLYSLFQLPFSDKNREKIFKKILDEKKSLHFAVEDLSASDSFGIFRIENIWRVKKLL
jgi:sporadic carbohydrate cluster protein (TIGR04323 family)